MPPKDDRKRGASDLSHSLRGSINNIPKISLSESSTFSPDFR